MRKAFVLLLFLPFSVFADQPARDRKLVCRVVDEGGHCVDNVEIELSGLERDALGISPEDEQSGKYRGWRFKTNAAGLFTARFGKFRQYDHQQATGMIEPGYGEFYFVAKKPGWAGAVSCELLNLNDEDLAEREKHRDDGYQSPEEGEEWQRGEFAPYVVPDATGKPLEMVLKRGLQVAGRMIYVDGSPVGDEEVNLFLDLHPGSHTGHGGEIFCQQTMTDQKGGFHFHSVYPNNFYVELLNHGNGPPYWVRTRVRNRWVDRIEDEIEPRHDEDIPNKYEKFIRLLIVAARRPPYRYFGQVTNLNDKPVAGAKVQIRCSLHEPERTFEDDHDYWWKTDTDEHGNYSLRVGSRFVNAIWVTAGQETGDDDSNEGELMAPGRYDITIRPKK